MNKDQQKMLQKRTHEHSIELNDESIEGQIVKDYQKLFENPTVETFIRSKDFHKLYDVQYQMVQNGNFYNCNYCSVVFIQNKDSITKHNNEVRKIDKKF